MQNDVILLETVANQAGVALRNGELIGQLRHEALHDALTGLPNRTNLQRCLGNALDDVKAGRASGAAVMVLDLDDFKQVNDTLGHEQGDLLLVELSARLSAAVGTAGSLARLGGDEFAILLPDNGDEDEVLRIGRRVLRALEQPVSLDGLEVEVSGSMGVALAPDHADDGRTAAAGGHGDVRRQDLHRGLRLYEPELDTNNPRRLTLVSELRSALQNGGIQVHVQPQGGSPTARSRGSRRWPAGATPSWVTSRPTSSSPSPSAAASSAADRSCSTPHWPPAPGGARRVTTSAWRSTCPRAACTTPTSSRRSSVSCDGTASRRAA